MVMEQQKLTPTQSRLYAILQDGRPHTVAELRAAIDDELSDPTNLRVHLFNLKRKLAAQGLSIAGKKDPRATVYCIVRDTSDDE